MQTNFEDKPMVVCDWTEWTPCCYPKTQEIKQMSYRYRTHFDCTGAERLDYEFQECPNPYSAWSEWSDCSELSCGGKGFLFRSRQVCQGEFEDQIENFACSVGYIGDECDSCDIDFYLFEDNCTGKVLTYLLENHLEFNLAFCLQNAIVTVWDQNLPVVQTTMALAPAKLDIPESSVKIVTKDSLEMKKATALVNLLSVVYQLFKIYLSYLLKLQNVDVMLPKDLKMFNVIPLDNVLAKIPTSA